MSQLFHWPPSWSTLYLLPALFVAFTVHELAHALVAFLLGDTSQVERKRLSFNPLRHVSWLGMLAFLLVGIGWAKPVWADATRFRMKNLPLGMFLVSVAGAAANLVLALLVLLGISAATATVWLMTGAQPAAIIQYLIASDPGPDAHGVVVALSYYMLSVNLLLAVFNLLPLPPLDGFQALVSLSALVRRGLKRTGGRESAQPPAASGTGEVPSAEAPRRSPAQIHFEIGLSYHKENHLDEAIARYRRAVENDDQLAEAYYNLGLAYWAKGRQALAASAFNAALRGQGNPAVRMQADARLRELSQAEREPELATRSVPPPLEPGGAVGLLVAAPPVPLDPALARRTWLQLGMGAVALIFLAAAAWLYVTGVTLMAMGG